jgi:hypothetical protein
MSIERVRAPRPTAPEFPVLARSNVRAIKLEKSNQNHRHYFPHYLAPETGH